MLRTRILAAATATLLALGMAAGGASPALAGKKPIPTPVVDGNVSVYTQKGLTCNDFPGTLADNLGNADGAGEYVAPSDGVNGSWGTVQWDANGISWVINPNWTVDLCVKGGNFVVWINDASGTGSYSIKAELYRERSHVNFANATYTAPTATPTADETDATCEVPTGTIFFGNVTGVAGYSVNGVSYRPGQTSASLPRALIPSR